MFRASRLARRKPGGTRHLDELRQAARFGLRNGGSERGNPVVATPLVVLLRRRPIARFDNQSLLEHSLNRSIQRPGAERQLSASPDSDVLDDGVAMPVLLGERQQDVERRRRQRQQAGRFLRDLVHAQTIATLDILSMAIDRRKLRACEKPGAQLCSSDPWMWRLD